jgi:hypothetical protein
VHQLLEAPQLDGTLRSSTLEISWIAYVPEINGISQHPSLTVSHTYINHKRVGHRLSFQFNVKFK